MEMEPLQILTEALHRSRSELLEEKGRQTAGKKGKARATEQDEEEEAEFRRQIEEYDNAISNVRDSFQAFMSKIKGERPPSRARSEHKFWSNSESKLLKTCFGAADEEDPIWNPLTSSYAYRETGLEPGPSCPSDNSREHQEDMKLEHRALKDASRDTKKIFAGLPQVWKYPEKTQPEALKYIPEEPTEVGAAIETLRTDHHAPTALRESATEDVDVEEDSVSRKPQGRFTQISQIVQSWVAPGLRKRLFGEKSIVDTTYQVLPDRTKIQSRLTSSNSSNLAVTNSEAGLSSASLNSTGIPPSSSSGSSKRRVLRSLRQTLGRRQSRSHSDSTGEPANLQGRSGPPNPANFVHTHAHEQSFSSGNFSQSLCEPVVSRPQRAQQQQRQKQKDDQYWHILGLDEQELGEITSEDETRRLALSFLKEDRAKQEEFELDQRLALELQLQEDGEVAARQAVLKQERLREEIERQAAAEAEHLNQELRAQEVVVQADGELAARLNDTYRALLSDREFCVQLLEREDTVEHPATPPLIGSWGEGSKARPRRDRSPLFQVPNSTQQSESQICNDRAFAQSLLEQDKKRVVREEEKVRNLTNTWRETIDKDTDRLRRRWDINPSQARASPQDWTTQQGYKQAKPGFEATQNAKSTRHDLVDEGACVICTDLFPKTQLVRPCEHFYCRGCLAGKSTPLFLQDPSRRGLTVNVFRNISTGNQR